MIDKFGQKGIVLAFAALVACTQATATDSAFADSASAPKQTWEFARLRSKVMPGDKIGVFTTGGWCIGKHDFSAPLKIDEFVNTDGAYAFKQVAKTIALPLFQKDLSPFESGTPASADFRVGGTLMQINVDWCIDNHRGKGETNLDIRWEVWSNKQQRVVMTKTTSGHAKFDDWDVNYENRAYIESLKALFDSQEAKDLMAGTLPPKVEAYAPLRLTAHPLAGTDTQKNAAQLKKAVVTVMSDSGSGSGFFVADGYLLTDRHVVGTSRYVKLRLWDGSETVGEVVREDAGRDVALLKTSLTTLPSIEVRATDPNSGENMFAIGSPLGQTFEGTFTRGVMSGTRDIAGRRFFQSDVAVTQGNSGGPLLDGSSQVVGLTDWGIPQAAGLSFFVPVKEALDKLHVTIDDAPAPAR